MAASVLTLFVGAVRGEGKTPVWNRPQGAPGASLRLRLESQDYRVYRAGVGVNDRARVFRGGNLTAGNTVISLYVPARGLERGDYLIKLSACDQQNQPESVADHTLRVTRK